MVCLGGKQLDNEVGGDCGFVVVVWFTLLLGWVFFLCFCELQVG